LKTLPPILTLSLLKFTYDMKTYQRIKILDKFEFPLELDLFEYLEDESKTNANEDYAQYELYSVVIHSGSAYGGHYHTYIKDVEKLGNWSLKASAKTAQKTDDVDLLRKEIVLIRENLTNLNELDYIKYESPLDLLKAYIYINHNYGFVAVDSVSNSLSKDAGISWNKSYKPRYGTLNKFFKKYNDTFELSGDEKSVKLKQHDYVQDVLTDNYETYMEEKGKALAEKMKDLQINVGDDDTVNVSVNENDVHWFDFNDSKINCIEPGLIQSQFEGIKCHNFCQFQ
jgi:ubiquitin carboxyl-terminal hydrolase 40